MGTCKIHLRAALVAGFTTLVGGDAAYAAKAATANTRAVILKPLTIVKATDLNFGNIVPGATAGTVTINAASGASSKTGGVTIFGVNHNAASFTVTGSGGHNYVITLSAAPRLTRAGGTQTMTMTALTLNGTKTRAMPAAGTATLTLGGTLAVAANQTPGSYTGIFSVTIAYP